MRKNRHYLFLDFEFTMPERRNKPFFPEIIEVGLVLVEDGQMKKQHATYVKPLHYRKLTERCKSFLDIRQEDVNGGISFHELLRVLRHYSHEGQAQVVTWGNMDMRVLRMSCEREKVPFPFLHDELDLAMEYKRFFGDKNQTGLWKAVEEYGKSGTGQHHRALDDALTTYHIFNLVEQDKRYLLKPEPTTIGDRVDFAQLYSKFAL